MDWSLMVGTFAQARLSADCRALGRDGSGRDHIPELSIFGVHTSAGSLAKLAGNNAENDRGGRETATVNR